MSSNGYKSNHYGIEMNILEIQNNKWSFFKMLHNGIDKVY